MKLKRCFDLIISSLGLICLSPVLLVISIWIKLDSNGPIFFRQVRIGLHQQPFKIFKFRTMIVNAESVGKQITVGQDPRVTRSGIFLRESKLDELPQLINVIIGDMSLVGPRPEVPRYVSAYSDNDKKYIFSVRPGITDNASIKYRDENEVLGHSNDAEKTYINDILPIKLQHYKSYVKNRTFSGDIIIILRTFAAILK